MDTFCSLFIPVHTIFSKTSLSVPMALLAFPSISYFIAYSSMQKEDSSNSLKD